MTHAAVYTVNLAVIEKATEIANADSKANGNLANLPYKIVHEGKNWLIAAFEDETFFDRNELYGFQVGNNSLVVFQNDVCDFIGTAFCKNEFLIVPTVVGNHIAVFCSS